VKPPRLATSTLSALCLACAAGGASNPSTQAQGAVLTLAAVSHGKVTLRFTNSGNSSVAYEHWMSQGPEPVPFCRSVQGPIRICAERVFQTPDGEPSVHETYLEPGDSVKFRAIPSGTEQVGLRMWRDGREEYLWLENWTLDTSRHRAR